MPIQTQVATEISVGTKIAVATLLLAGLGALGYASGYVKLDYQSSQAVSDASAQQCDCLWQCTESRKACISSGRSIEDCNGDLGACVDSCEPVVVEGTKEASLPPIDQCDLTCKDSYESCLKNGGSKEECLTSGAECMCSCNPTFAPPAFDNSCAESCRDVLTTCEAANTSDPTKKVDCDLEEGSCLNSCDLWCNKSKDGDKSQPSVAVGEPNDGSTVEDTCSSSCDADYDQCLVDSQTTAGLDCIGRKNGCLLECGEDNNDGSLLPPADDGTNGDPNGGEAGVTKDGTDPSEKKLNSTGGDL
ncbi:hypothetical protein HQ487_01935 [Candidatus Uhrbacteria bacterium]|nr:hypothetical protein [Candidatus Uhrbacteria bacterium]